MRLVDHIRRETGADYPQIMLLRHINIIARLVELGGSVEEFTSLQPTGQRWDFWKVGKPQIDIVVVIVADRVHGVYRVLGIEAEGTIGSLADEPHLAFNAERNRGQLTLPARRFKFEAVPSAAVGARVTGWDGKAIAAVLRSTGELFRVIEADLWDDSQLTEEVADAEKLFEGAVCRVTVNAYERNAKARLECIKLFGARCFICAFDFPATYGDDFAGFIHVHHLLPLSEVGKEYEVVPAEHLRPVCPNCHAIIHHGGRLRTVDEVRQLLRR